MNISGVVAYNGRQPGAIQVVAVTASNDWATNYSATLSDPGAYMFLDAPGRTDLWVRAFRDMNTNGVAESFEAYGEYENPVNATGDVSRVVIALTDPDIDGDGLFDWWEVWYWGNIGQVAFADSDGDRMTNSQEYEWRTDPTNPDTDGDGFQDWREVEIGTEPLDASSFPVSISGFIDTASFHPPVGGMLYVLACDAEGAWASRWATSIPVAFGTYTIFEVPSNRSYWVKAYVDVDGDLTNDFWEPSGIYGSNPVVLTNSVSGIDITIGDPDTDHDGLADWWELFSFGDLSQYGFMDSDHDWANNEMEYYEYLKWGFGSDPYGDSWVESHSRKETVVRWNPPRVPGISYYSYIHSYAIDPTAIAYMQTVYLDYALGDYIHSYYVDPNWTSDFEVVTNVASYGDSGATSVTLNTVEGAWIYKIELRGHDAQGQVLWERYLQLMEFPEWIQMMPGSAFADLTSSLLFPAVTNQALPNAPTGTVVMSREGTASCIGGWDVFYVSGSALGYSGVNLTGVHLEYEVPAGTEFKTASFRVHQGGSCTIKVKVVSDGTGRIAINQPLYFQRWSPGIAVSF